MYAASLLWVGLALSPQGEGAAPAVGHEGHAADAATSRSVRFEQALERARQLGPVRALRQASHKLEGQTVGLGPLVRNPTVELAPNLRFAPSSDLGPEGQLTVRVPLDVVGLGAARERVVAGVGAELGAQAEQLALDESSNAAAAWLSLWATVEARSVAERDLELARELSRKLVLARRAEEATAVDVLDAELLAEEAELTLIGLEGERHDRALRLARALGLPPVPLLTVEGGLPLVAAPPPGAQTRWSGESPAARRAARAAELAAARSDEAKAASSTDLSVGWTLIRDAPNGWTTGAIVSVSLPWLDRARASTAEHDAQTQWWSAMGQLEQERARADLAQALHEVEHTREVMVRLREQVLPRHESVVAARTRLVEAGESTVHELVLARRALVGVRRREIDARAAHALACVQATLLYEAGAPSTAPSAGARR